MNKHADDAESVFLLYSLGVVTAKDAFVYAWTTSEVERKVSNYLDVYNGSVGRYIGDKDNCDIDDFAFGEQRIKWSFRIKQELLKGKFISFGRDRIRKSLYRPFTKQFLYFDHLLNERRYQQHRVFPDHNSERDNRVICVSGLASEKPFYALITNIIPNYAFVGFGGPSQCFPFYSYDPDGTNRKENITDTVLHQFREHYHDTAITKWDIFYYIYGLLHHPKYRETFKDCLKRDFPRIPFAPDFRAFESAGKKLADSHLNYESATVYDLKWVEATDEPIDWKVGDKKMKLTKDMTSLIYNHTLTLTGIPPETYEYRLGNKSALHWIIDQYRVKTDKRSGLVSDPNCADDPQYIVNLIGRIVQVSVDTVRIVNGLPSECW